MGIYVSPVDRLIPARNAETMGSVYFGELMFPNCIGLLRLF